GWRGRARGRRRGSRRAGGGYGGGRGGRTGGLRRGGRGGGRGWGGGPAPRGEGAPGWGGPKNDRPPRPHPAPALHGAPPHPTRPGRAPRSLDRFRAAGAPSLTSRRYTAGVAGRFARQVEERSRGTLPAEDGS